MSESILRALMQLFALVAKVEGVSKDGRSIVKLFLKQQLSADLVQDYLNIFEEYLELHQKNSTEDGKARKKTSVNSVKVLRICISSKILCSIRGNYEVFCEILSMNSRPAVTN